ncbi:hypothetical protein QVD17_16791 [Tagetes erecta]|uniref:RNase H type-1 domain-containing protein n=1 Tax=Tagetes erecta TaxID=13708 RepID=A0AAD8KYC8_TARER|nr:hypothetical protein QVD17_16791 [Tagetes erecta]
MKLNPAKCSFGFEEGKFLGHIIDKQGIKANPSQIQAVLDMKSPQTTKQNCVDKKDFKWTIEAEAAFQDLKKQIAFLPTITAPMAGELITVYLSAGMEAISVVLVVERAKVPCTNNEAEYEALLAGLRIARSMKVEELEAFGDSRLVANQKNHSAHGARNSKSSKCSAP